MNDNVKKWVEALRSGEYVQTQNKLKGRVDSGPDAPVGFCCLGVACDMYGKETGLGKWMEHEDGSFEFVSDGETKFSNQNEFLPIPVMKWLGISENDGAFKDDLPTADFAGLLSLVSLNDHNYTFEQIADAIEFEPDGLFKKDQKCVLCGEGLEAKGERAEMHGPPRPRHGVDDNVMVSEGIVHGQCGLNAGWEVS